MEPECHCGHVQDEHDTSHALGDWPCLVEGCGCDDYVEYEPPQVVRRKKRE